MKKANKTPIIYKDKVIEDKLNKIEEINHSGLDKTWVNKVMLAGLMHFNRFKKAQDVDSNI